MHYMGGKHWISKPITEAILAAAPERGAYVEPFVGAGSIAERMAPHFRRSYLSDASADLIALWRALQRGWEPPYEVSEAEYAQLRLEAPSALRGFAGYGCSFGGKWFGGYARNNYKNNYAQQARNSLLRKIGRLTPSMIYQAPYQSVMVPVNSVVYLDPPYAGTTGFSGLAAFDSAAFWQWAERLSGRASVFVSEYSAPDGWAPIWQREVQAALKLQDKTGRVAEKLWTYSPSRR